MPPTVVGTPTYASSASTTSLTVAKPSGLGDGELLLGAAFFRNTPADLSTGATTIPAGFVRLTPWHTSGNGVNEAWRKTIPAAAAETATSYTWAVPTANGANRAAGFLLRVADVDLDNPQDAAGTAANSATAPGLTTATAGALLCYLVVQHVGSATPLTTVPPAIPGGGSMTKVAEVTCTAGTSSTTVALCVEARPTAGATGTRTATFTGGTPGSAVSWLFSLTPAPVTEEPPGGWAAEGGGVTLSALTGGAMEGSTSLRATKTFSAGLDTLRINTGGQLGGNLSAYGNTFSTLLRVTASGGIGWRVRMEVLVGGVWQAGGWWSITPDGTIIDLFHTPAGGILDAVQDVGFHLEATGVNGPVLFDVDQLRQGTYTPALTPLQSWQAADRATYEAVHEAGFVGVGRFYDASSYEWSDARNYDQNGAPWIPPLAGLTVRYAGQLYFDNGDTGTYPVPYATEVTNAAGQGYASPAARALDWFSDFRDWLATYGVPGVLEETGWPDSSDWNPVGAAVLAAAATAGIDVTVWAVGELLGTSNQLSVWEWDGDSYNANPQATVVGTYLTPPLVEIGFPVLPNLSVLMAIGGETLTDPQAAGIFELGASLLDGPDVLGTVAWVDVTADVRSISVRPDPGDEYDPSGPTTVELVLDNYSGDYDPINPASSYDLDVGQQVWIRAEVDGIYYDVAYAYIDDIIPDYGREPTVTFSCSDGLTILGRAYVGEIPASFDGDTSGQRINRILDAALWPTGQRLISTGQVTVQADTYGDYALPLIDRIVTTELGALFIDGAGNVVFYDRLQVYTGARSTEVQATFSDSDPNAISYPQLSGPVSRSRIYNEAHVSRVGSDIVQIAVDAASQNKYGPAVYTGSAGSMARSDADALGTAAWIVAREKTPASQFPELPVDGTTEPDRATLLGLRRFDRVRLVRDYQPDNGAPPIDRELIVAAVAHEFVAGERWTLGFRLRDLDAFTPFVLNVSKLDSTAQLI